MLQQTNYPCSNPNLDNSQLLKKEEIPYLSSRTFLIKIIPTLLLACIEQKLKIVYQYHHDYIGNHTCSLLIQRSPLSGYLYQDIGYMLSNQYYQHQQLQYINTSFVFSSISFLVVYYTKQKSRLYEMSFFFPQTMGELIWVIDLYL